jgi:hypothetical protein
MEKQINVNTMSEDRRSLVSTRISDFRTFEEILHTLQRSGYTKDSKKGVNPSSSYLFVNLEEKKFYTAGFSGGLKPLSNGGMLNEIFVRKEEDRKKVEKDLFFSDEDKVVQGDGMLELDSDPGPSPFDGLETTYAPIINQVKKIGAIQRGKDKVRGETADHIHWDEMGTYPVKEVEKGNEETLRGTHIKGTDAIQLTLDLPDNSFREPDPKLISIEEAIQALEREKAAHLAKREVTYGFKKVAVNNQKYVAIAHRGDGHVLAIRESVLNNPGGNKVFNWFALTD